MIKYFPLLLLPLFNGCITGRTNITDKRPNIIILFVDDLGYYNVGFRNNIYSTPHIDDLAQNGVVFDNAYVPSPTCSPSRVGLLTGQHPARLQFFRHVPNELEDDAEFNLWNNDSSLLLSRNWLPAGTTTYAEVMKKKGYNTFFAGKWHIGNKHFGPEKFYFDEAITNEPVGHPNNYYPPYFHGGGWWSNLPEEKYLTDFLTDQVVTYIEGYISNDPFLLHLSYFNVHGPNIGKKEYIDHYREKGFEGRELQFCAQLSAVDESVGRIINALNRTGKTNNSLIVFTSDQGSRFSNHPLRGGKADAMYEGGQKVPFIISWPSEISKGKNIFDHIQTTDLFPTLCEIVGENTGNYPNLEGVSLWDLIKYDEPLARDAIVTFRSYDSICATVLTKDKWKLITKWNGVSELYKLDEDISEERDLALMYPEKVTELMRILKEWSKRNNISEK